MREIPPVAQRQLNATPLGSTAASRQGVHFPSLPTLKRLPKLSPSLRDNDKNFLWGRFKEGICAISNINDGGAETK